MVILEQLKLSIEESNGPNDGHSKGGGEKQFVEHHFLLVYDLGKGQTAKIYSSFYKPCWGEDRLARPVG